MNGFQKRKKAALQKPFLGCIGSMINIFDLSAGMPGTKMLADKPHRDVSPNCRRHDAVKRVPDPVVAQIEEPVVGEMRKSLSRKESGGTPMKMLIAQEMTSETDPKQKPTNVVAQLMGLKTLPAQQQGITTITNLQEGYLHSNFSNQYGHENVYKDVYEVWEQPSRINICRSNENMNGKRMALVRQKFIEAKRLSTDVKLLQSKEFQDALEVLCSNKDLFLKFLEEPNSLFSKQLDELHAVPTLPQTKRITILKPSKTDDIKDEKQVWKQKHGAAIEDLGKETEELYTGSSLGHLKTENRSQPTRIVVLKPSPGKCRDVSTAAYSPTSAPKLSEVRDTKQDPESDKDSREVATEITQQMRESFSSHRRDESLLSSVLSNGYIGDDSSFNKSENAYVEEDGNFSDLDFMTPTSRHSWDCANNRFGSPYSRSSFSRASYSTDSSVIREAKKRLSERLALVASNGIDQEKRHVRRSSSTLGEMLAIPEANKKDERSKVSTVSSSRSCGGEEDLRASSTCSSSGRMKDATTEENVLRNLSRSKSVPVSSSAYENIDVNFKASVSLDSKPAVSKESNKSKSGKSSSFTGKVSSLFFSRNKKAVKEKPLSSASTSTCDKIKPASEPADKCNDALQKGIHNNLPRQSRLTKAKDVAVDATSPPTPADKGSIMSTLSLRDALALEKCITTERSTETLDQPSPNSVLEPAFRDDASISTPHSSECISTPHSSECISAPNPQALSRSAPIESLARTLSWDECQSKVSSGITVKQPKVFSKAHHEEQEQEKSVLFQKLFSLAGFGRENWNIVFSKWYSPESPLDPVLLDAFLDRKVEAAKCRKKRSNQRLLFDCVNIALLQISQTATIIACPLARNYCGIRKTVSLEIPVIEEVCEIVGNWLSIDIASSDGDNCSLVVDSLVRKEVGGTGWSESIWWEMYEVSKEIGGQVLEQLVREAFEDFNVSCL